MVNYGYSSCLFCFKGYYFLYDQYLYDIFHDYIVHVSDLEFHILIGRVPLWTFL